MLFWWFTNSRGTLSQVLILEGMVIQTRIVVLTKLAVYLCLMGTSDVASKWSSLEWRTDWYVSRLSWTSQLFGPLGLKLFFYMGAPAGQLNVGFKARPFGHATLFLCLCTPTFSFGFDCQSNRLWFCFSQIDRDREKKKCCPAWLLLFSTAYWAAASRLRLPFWELFVDLNRLSYAVNDKLGLSR